MSAQSDSRLTPLTQMLQSIFSDNSNIMLAAIISLLLVILFVLLLHLYAKWFLAHAQAHARSRRRRRSTVSVSDVLGPPRFHHFHTFNLQDSPASNSPSKGLDSAAIAAIPVFVYAETGDRDKEQRKKEHELECVICLSAFVDGEIGRSLPKCGHAFHVECIDMWLTSHSSCPICRAPIAGGIVEHDSQTDDSSGLLEIVVDSHSSETSENEHGNEGSANNSNNDNGGVSDNSAISVSETSSSLLRCSFKRMLSKVFPSANVDELNQ